MKEATQRQLAALLNLTTQQVRNLEDKGLPYRAEGRSKFYPLPGAIEWYVTFKQREAINRVGGGRGGLDESRARRERARARLAEIEVAKAEGQVVPTDVVEEVYGDRLLGALRATILNMPGRWGTQIVGLSSPREAEAALKRIGIELLEEMSGSAADRFEQEANSSIPEEFPHRSILQDAGITTMSDLLAVDDYTAIPGIGPARQREILERLGT